MSKLTQAILKIANVQMNESVFDDSLFADHEKDEHSEHEELERKLDKIKDEVEEIEGLEKKENKCLEEDEGLPEDYQSCHQCMFDHEYEPEEAQRAHQLLESKEWKECCASSKTADHYNPYMGRKTVPTTSMPMIEMPELKGKPSHVEFPEMPKSKSKKDVLLQEMQDILKELEDIELDE